ncbi:hypothetical protein Tco_0680968 [Tanacetum coccineum]|uniref:Uncharacterized protein n=1 Tax=Tanacetum coccineum TaxID=301880 RepID=A0ABQ4XMA0_9ASTR
MVDSDLEEDPEEDPEEDHADYPADGGDGDDEPSDDEDTDDEDEEASEDEDDDEEEEEHLTLADSSVVPVTRLRRARKTVRPQTPIPFPSETEIPLPPLHVSSSPLPLPSPVVDSPTYTEEPLGYRAAKIRMRVASPPLLLPSTSHRTDILEVEMPPRKRSCFTTPASRFEVGESLAAAVARQPGPTLEADLGGDRVRGWKMPPKRRTTRTSTPTTPMTDAQIKALIDQGVADALAEHDAERSKNDDDSHDSGTGGRRHVSTV